MKATVRRLAGIATLFGTVTAAAGQHLIRHGSAEDVEARHADVLRQNSLTDDTRAARREFGMTDADFARAGSASDLPVVVAYDDRVDLDRVEAQRFPEQDLCLVRLPKTGDGLDATINTHLPPGAIMPVNTSPEEDRAFRKIAFLRGMQDCAPAFDSLRAEHQALVEFLHEGGDTAFLAAEIDWQILNAQFGVSFAAPDGVDQPLRPDYFGDGLVLRAAFADEKIMTLAEARVAQREAIAALHDYARGQGVKYAPDAAGNLRLGRQLVDDILADKAAAMTPGVRQTLTAVQQAYNRLAGDTHEMAARPVSLPHTGEPDEAARRAAIEEAIDAYHLLLGPGVRDEYDLLPANGLSAADALAMIGPRGNVTLIPQGKMPAGLMSLGYVGGAHVLQLASDGITLRNLFDGSTGIPVGVGDAGNRDFAKLALLEKLRQIGQGPEVAPTEAALDAEIAAQAYYLKHGGDATISAGELGERTVENFLGILGARGRDDFEPASYTLRAQGALAHAAPISGAQEQAAADEVFEAIAAYGGSHRAATYTHGSPDLSATVAAMLADPKVTLTTRGREYLELCATGLRFIAGTPAPPNIALGGGVPKP